jgi:hypothetical protein
MILVPKDDLPRRLGTPPLVQSIGLGEIWLAVRFERRRNHRGLRAGNLGDKGPLAGVPFRPQVNGYFPQTKTKAPLVESIATADRDWRRHAP